MTPQQIDQKVKEYLDRAIRIIITKKIDMTRLEIREIAKLIQEEEHHQEQMELIKRLEKS